MATTTTILLVDDEESIQKLLTFPLERDGYRVVQARDGEEALERFRAEEIDLVLLDLALPKLDGVEVCRRLRAESTVPILMLTARDDEIDKVLGLEIGADDYITKPFSIRELRSRIRAAIRRAALTPAPEPDDVIEADELRIDLPRRSVEVRGEGRPAHVPRVRAPAHARRHAGPGLLAPDAARPPVGRRGLPGSTHDRRPRAPPAGEDRTRPERSRVHLHRARRRVSLPGFVMAFPRPPVRATLAVKLALVFFGAVAGALAIVYLMVVPRLEGRLVDAKINEVELASPAVLRELIQADAAGTGALNQAVDDAARRLERARRDLRAARDELAAHLERLLRRRQRGA